MKSLSLIEFGDALLRTRDLDPVYVAIHGAGLSGPQLPQLLTAYWCFYSLGAAAYISEAKTPKEFWKRMMAAAINETAPPPKPGERWPRAAERRHFRGAQAVSSVAGLAARYGKGAEQFVSYLYRPFDNTGSTFNGVAARAREHRGFGEWIAFKIADMGERVLGFDVDFTDCHLGIYKDPRQGAALSYYLRFSAAAAWPVAGEEDYSQEPWKFPVSDVQLKQEVDRLVAFWRGRKFKAPPSGDRLVNVQEIETILCKYKSYYKGHYHVGKDIDEVRHGLERWGDTAQQLAKALPPSVMRG